MADRRTLSAVTLTVLVCLLAAAAFLGWRALSSPLPDSDDEAGAGPRCDSGLAKGDVVRTKDVTVSVYNAGSRSGLASQTRDELAARGFIPGDAGNAPEELESVRFVRILAPSTKDPAARLVAAQFGRNTLIAATREDLGPGVDLVVGDSFVGLVKAPRKIRATAPGSGC